MENETVKTLHKRTKNHIEYLDSEPQMSSLELLRKNTIEKEGGIE